VFNTSAELNLGRCLAHTWAHFASSNSTKSTILFARIDRDPAHSRTAPVWHHRHGVRK